MFCLNSILNWQDSLDRTSTWKNYPYQLGHFNKNLWAQIDCLVVAYHTVCLRYIYYNISSCRNCMCELNNKMHIDAHRSKGCMTHIINTYQSTSLRYCVHTHLSSLSTWRSYSNGSWRLPTTAWGCWKRWLIPWTQLPPATSQPGMRGAAVAAMMNVEFQWSESCNFNHIGFLIDIVLPLHHYFIYLQPI